MSSHYAELGGRAVIELATLCGTARLPGGVADPLRASSRGLGEAVIAALDEGANHITLTLGGSASTDGGAGMLNALGARLLDSDGAEVADGGGNNLPLVDRVDLSGLDPRVRRTPFVVACDVDNPLLGAHGTTAVFAAQKGAGLAERERPEDGLGRFSTAITTATGRDHRGSAGAGAAGGVGFAALAALDATRVSGVELVLTLIDFPARLGGARLVVTGEGCLDEQTFHGKAPAGVIAAARETGVEAVATCGRSTLGAEGAQCLGVGRIYRLTDLEPDPERCIKDAEHLLRVTGRSVAQEWLLSSQRRHSSDPEWR